MNEEIKYCQCCKLRKGKICKTCDIDKPVTDYDTGRLSCKECRKKYNARYYQTKKDIESVEKLYLKKEGLI